MMMMMMTLMLLINISGLSPSEASRILSSFYLKSPRCSTKRGFNTIKTMGIFGELSTNCCLDTNSV